MLGDDGFRIRKATRDDAGALCVILNEIIALGGTTALETLLDAGEFDAHFLTGRDCVVCFMAEDLDGAALGFQSLTRNWALPEGWADIASFTRREPRVPGTGTALFNKTVNFARDFGFVAINATIRADNYSGIPYYEKIGFQTYDVTRQVPLKSGALVDRVSKRYFLG